MALPARQQTIYWGVAALVFFLALWGLGNVLLPYVVGGAIAYFLDPVADRLERMGLSRTLATALITLVAALVFVLLVFLIVPTLVRQATQLVYAMPQISAQLQSFLTTHFPDLMNNDSVLRETLGDLGQVIKERGAALVGGIWSSAMSLVNAVIFLIVVPVVAFYLLLDWDSIVARVDTLVPLDHRETVRGLARDIDRVLAGFVRGQVTVCMTLGTYYSVGLMLAGLEFGLFVGAFAGLITFIPYLGSLLGGILAIGLAFFQFWGDWLRIGIVAAVFMAGQFFEGNILTPKLVGKSVGLHPVWLLLALSVFGALFGFVGMLVAVPVSAVIGVLARFAAGKYVGSRLYIGRRDAERDEG